MGSFNWEILVGFIVLIVAVFVFAIVFTAKRIHARKEAAKQLGFVAAPSDPEFDRRVLAFYGQKYPNAYKVKNVYKRSVGDYDLYAFDIYMSTSNSSGGNVRPAVALIAPNFKLPRFSLTSPGIYGFLGRLAPRKKPGRIANAIIERFVARAGMKRIHFENPPEFRDFYILIAEDETAVRKLFDAKLINWFVSLSCEPGMRDVAVTAQDGLLTWAWPDALPGDTDALEHLRNNSERIKKLYELLAPVGST